MTNAMTAIASRERNPTQHSTAMSRATLREAAYRSKLPLLEGPNRPTTEKPALTSALTVVTMAQVQKRRIISTHLRRRWGSSEAGGQAGVIATCEIATALGRHSTKS